MYDLLLLSWTVLDVSAILIIVGTVDREAADLFVAKTIFLKKM